MENISIKELSPATWSDFERFFSKYGGVRGGCWCTYYHRLPNWQKLGRDGRKKEKKKLVWEGRSHGILVYANNEPIGWCQFGSNDELSTTPASRDYHKLRLESEKNKLWRITCFFVDKGYRRKGIARLALKAVLKVIKNKGGGIVEAYPWALGKGTTQWGTTSMYEEEGFKVASRLGKFYLLMRKTI